MNFAQIAQDRRSIKSYTPDVSVSDQELDALFRQVVLTPSAFNLQHWRFIAVRDQDVKAAMQEAAWNQPQVGTSSVAILVTGKLNAYEDAAAIYDDSPADVRERMVPMVDDFYAGKAQAQRDEAIRSASMAAMTLMYAAKDQGFDTGPMIGFDPDAMAKVLHVPADHVPVMLIVLGKGEPAHRGRSFRHPLTEVVKLDRFDGAGLGAA